MNSSKIYYYWLDPIRALAALLVLFVHARGIMFDLYVNLEQQSHNLFTQIFYFICSQGHISVAVFFILSGFLVGGKNLERLRKNTISPKSFIVNRIFRIGIPLTGAIAIIIIVDLFLGNPLSLTAILGQYLGLQFIVGDFGGVFWTLSYEIWFYLILFSIILTYSSKRNVVSGIISFVICCCIVIQMEFVWFCIIGAGIVAYRLKDYDISKKDTNIAFVSFLIFLILYFLSQPSTNVSSLKVINSSVHQFVWIACCWSLAIVLSQIVKCKPTSRIQVWSDKYGRTLATFSYSLFLTHYQILKIYKYYFGKFSSVDFYSIMAFIGVCAFCVLVAWLFHLAFENNTQQIQSWALKKLKQK